MDFKLIKILIILVGFIMVMYKLLLGQQLKKTLKIYDNLNDIDGNKFCLFLRSFDEDDYIADYSAIANNPLKFSESYSLELQLYDKLRNNPPVLMVKPPDNLSTQFEANIVSMDSEWKKYVLDLLYNSKFIVIKPANSEGLLWEFQQIIKLGHLPKTIFINKFGDGDFPEIEKLEKDRFFRHLRENFKIEDNCLITKKYFTIELDTVLQYSDLLKIPIVEESRMAIQVD